MYHKLTKVCQLQLADLADEQVLRLDVSVEYFSPVTIGEATQQLEHKQLDVSRLEAARVVFQVLRQVGVLQKKKKKKKTSKTNYTIFRRKKVETSNTHPTFSPLPFPLGKMGNFFSIFFGGCASQIRLVFHLFLSKFFSQFA